MNPQPRPATIPAPADRSQASVDEIHQDAQKYAFDRLTPLGWRAGLAAILASLAASFFLFGYALVYWRNADMDFMVVYNALALNDGKPQLFFDHTAYLTILLVQFWFRLLHAAGLLEAWTLSAIPSSAIPSAGDVTSFNSAMTSAIRAGRLLALMIACAAVLGFASLMRPLVRDWRVAFLATLAFAMSGGLAVHSRIMRSELIAACPVIFALMIVIASGNRASRARPAWLAVAGGLCLLGLENKVQAILLIAALPVLVLPFGSAAGQSVAFWREGPWRWVGAGISLSTALAAAALAAPLIATGFDHGLLEAAHFHPLLLNRFGTYQMALAVLIGIAMTGYGVIWRISPAETLASMAAVATGALAALLVLNLEYNPSNVVAALNPLEKMLTFADATTSATVNGSSLWNLLLLVCQSVAAVLARYSFVLHSSPRPTVFLTWLIAPGIVYAWRRGESQAATKALLLLLAAIGIDALGVRRGLKSEYFIFTDPLIILAGAILLDRLTELQFQKWTYPIAIGLFGLHLAVGQAEPIKYATMRRGPEPICDWSPSYMPLLPLPWCDAGMPAIAGSGAHAKP
jgi:hypothetical protein